MRRTVRTLALAVTALAMAAACRAEPEVERATDSTAAPATVQPQPTVDSSPTPPSVPTAVEPTPTAQPPAAEPVPPLRQVITNPMAVVDDAPSLDVHGQPGGGLGNVFAELDPSTVGVHHYPGQTAEADGTTWLQIGNPQSRDFDGWVDAETLIAVEGDGEQTWGFYTTVSATRTALSADEPWLALSTLIEQLGADEIVISVDGYFAPEDPALSSADLQRPEMVWLWGHQDGTGDPIETTWQEIAQFLAAEAELGSTDRISVNERLHFGNTIDNAREFFPNSIVVEIHHPGEGELADFNWTTLRLVFVDDEDGVRLVGIAHDHWTI